MPGVNNKNIIFILSDCFALFLRTKQLFRVIYITISTFTPFRPCIPGIYIMVSSHSQFRKPLQTNSSARISWRDQYSQIVTTISSSKCLSIYQTMRQSWCLCISTSLWGNKKMSLIHKSFSRVSKVRKMHMGSPLDSLAWLQGELRATSNLTKS